MAQNNITNTTANTTVFDHGVDAVNTAKTTLQNPTTLEITIGVAALLLILVIVLFVAHVLDSAQKRANQSLISTTLKTVFFIVVAAGLFWLVTNDFAPIIDAYNEVLGHVDGVNETVNTSTLRN